MSVVYFIGTEGHPFVKIGTSCGNPKARLQQLQAACPLRLRLLALVRGDGKLERRLHDTFAACRLHGEWFEHRGKLTDFIMHLVTHCDDGLVVSEEVFRNAVAEVVVLGLRRADHELTQAEYLRTGNPVLWPEIVMEVV